jgi:DNA mismatch endonuclease (patch repair protein)
MVDVLTEKQRQYCMSRIKGKNTKPEMIVRKLAFALGYRYRLHDGKLPGKPDLVFVGRHKVIFVHGCYWHRHDCKYGKVIPQTRKKFWEEKLAGNKERDKKNVRELKKLGWDVLIIWECETKETSRYERMVAKIDGFLKS